MNCGSVLFRRLELGFDKFRLKLLRYNIQYNQAPILTVC
jgi:hypothetical protein